MKKLSIITINYNNNAGLKRTINSVFSQTFIDYEYIIIDGGSTDGSKELIEVFSDKLSYWVSEPDQGIYNAMNKGILNSKCEYLLFLNSGDVLINDDILNSVKINLFMSDIIYGNGILQEISGTKIKMEMPDKLSMKYFLNSSLFHPSTFIKRKLFEDFGLYNESNKIVSDWEFFIKTIILNKVTVKKIDSYISMVEDGGISRSIEYKNILTDEIKSVHNKYNVNQFMSSKISQGNMNQSISLFKMLFSFFNIGKLVNKSDLKSKFTEIHDKNLFNGKESVSGTGSDLFQTRIISKEIPRLTQKYGVQIFIDAPCGDFFWMQHVEFNNIKYIGLDIVEKLIEVNSVRFGSINRIFECRNIVSEKLPEGDLILIRDCWVHLSYRDILDCLMNLKRSNIKYLLTTSFPNCEVNTDLYKIWRPLNLQKEPFNFPEPIDVILEGCTEDEGRFKDKSLLLWEISLLPVFKLA